ncbi:MULTISPECIES: hypothetical protein [unclassified Maricaulis]|jgi:hypothetical protein|uniref:hypothetical protein n=1 Tax=unclassified Maricaulis TaxID=2632371 RepID=UPI000A410A24|nr:MULTISPECIES: hypothetical protein [unclassified Maricaulis]
MGFLKFFGVPEGMTAAEARALQKLEARGVAPETVASAEVKAEATLADDDGVEVGG